MVAAVLLLLVQVPAPAAPCAGCVAAPAQSAAPSEAGVMTGTVRDIAGGVVPGMSAIMPRYVRLGCGSSSRCVEFNSP